MKREKLYRTAFALAVALLAASCDKEEFADRPADDPGSPQQIRFEISASPAAATPSGASTRVATGPDGQGGFLSAFTDGDRVGLFIVKDGETLRSTGNWVDNAVMSYKDGKWTCSLPDDRKYFPQDGSRLSFYAYYPYKEGTDPLAVSFTVRSDQSAEGFAASHLMTADKQLVSRSKDPVPLAFRPRLALVKVSLKDGSGAKDKAPRPADVVMLKGRLVETTLNLATGHIYSSGDAADVKMHFNAADKCWYALVPAQVTAPRNELLLTFEWTGLTKLSHRSTTGHQLLPGEVKPLNITINVNMTPDPNHVYAVGDAYPYVGFYNKEGVVFEVSDDGKSGKMLGLKWKTLAWSNDITTYIGVNDMYNGRTNMETIRKTGKINDYPAFQWVHELNGSPAAYPADAKNYWYIPARNELQAVGRNREKLAPALESLALESPLWGYIIWSSSESNGNNASALAPNTGVMAGCMKNDKACVWPIRAF